MTLDTQPADRSWIQIGIDATKDDAESWADALSCAGALSVTLEDAGDDPIIEPGPGETPLWPRIVVVGLFDRDKSPGEILREVQRRLELAHPPRGRISVLEDREWERTWRDHFRPMQFGRLYVYPSEDVGDAPRSADTAVVSIDPGLAFGTGTHPTTALCLEWLAFNCREGDRLIDYGCGSGIISLAAAKLGASRVWAVDIDPQALRASATNAAHNGVERQISIMQPGDLPDIRVDCLIANILARPLVELMPRFASLLRPGGQLVVSGILAEQQGDVMSALPPAFRSESVHEREGWVLIHAIRC
jgi:ribosomal protein L11 methyltransferase